MTWHLFTDPKRNTVDPINDPSFPWSKGRPNWPLWHSMKNDERMERNKRKGKKAPEYSRNNCQYVDIKGVCGVKAYGMIEVAHGGQTALVPVCENHRPSFDQQ